ncbi:MAG TPA: PEP-utilizing enzyme [Syntrophobacteraceae bacterium]|nr:PEP-utilizing enzyme [Syntrophobacteraceae bacterium]
MAQATRFPYPEEIVIPKELEGWEEMYPSVRLFQKDREEWDKMHFWFQDKIHASEPLYPLDDIFQEAWQIALSQYTTRVFTIPPAQGVAQRLLGCYMYITPVVAPPPEIIGQKVETFTKRVPWVIENFDKLLWGLWIDKFKKLGAELKALTVPTELPMSVPDSEVFPATLGYTDAYRLIEAWNTAVSLIFKSWQMHFEYLNITYLSYVMFLDTARKLFPGIKDSTLGRMVAGAQADMFRPDEELCKLARSAHARPAVAQVLKSDATADEKIASLNKFDSGLAWLEELDKAKDPWFYVSCGGGWYHHEGSWITQMDVPLAYLKSYIERLDKGEKIERSYDAISAERNRIVGEYRELIKTDEDRKSFDDAYKTIRTIYRFAEDHIFWVEHWMHTIWFGKVREFGALLQKRGAIDEVDDIFLFNKFEVPELIQDVATAWALGEGVPTRGTTWKAKVEKRKKILAAAAKWPPAPALGIPPAEVAEPFIISLWGIQTDTVAQWLSAAAVKADEVTELKGFASSIGIAEGPARVLMLASEIPTLKEGEIMIVPSTSPSWAPVFTKVKAAVTDIGGIACHAAIVCREYNLPSVTGTMNATSVIKTGDTVRVDGTSGTVTILKRA